MDEVSHTAFHEAGHAVAAVTAFKDARWLPNPPPSPVVLSVEIVDNANDLQTIVADGNADKHHSSRAQPDCSAARASSYRWATGRLYNRRDSVLRVISPGVHWTIDTSILT